MKGSEIFAPSTGLWKHKSNGMVLTWIYGDHGRLVYLNDGLARIWFQIDGVRTVDQLADAVGGTTSTETGLSRDRLTECVEQLLNMGLIYRIGDVWANACRR